MSRPSSVGRSQHRGLRCLGPTGGIVSTSVMHGLANAVRIFPGDLEELALLDAPTAPECKLDMAKTMPNMSPPEPF